MSLCGYDGPPLLKIRIEKAKSGRGTWWSGVSPKSLGDSQRGEALGPVRPERRLTLADLRLRLDRTRTPQ